MPQAIGANDNANDLIQSHELEASYALTNWWLLQVTTGFEQPLGEDFRLSEVSLESVFPLIRRQGDGIALSLQGGYAQAIQHGDPNQIGFGPIVELAKGPFLLTLNPVLTKQAGNFANQAGPGLEHGWRAAYDLSLGGASALRCSERSSRWPIPARSTIRTTA